MKWREVLRRIALVVVLVASTAGFGVVVNEHYPIQKWLFWHYAEAWVFALYFVAACFVAGTATVLRVLPGDFHIGEGACIAFAVGMFEFFLGMFIAGLLGLYGSVFFFVWPLLMIGAGARPFWRRTRRLFRHLRYRRRKAQPPPWWTLPVLAFGLAAIGMIYFTILTPENVAFDSRWEHLGLAEHYVAAGRIGRFPEGWFVATSPHFAAILYTWAFLLPHATVFDHAELAAHMEFVAFLFTLVGVGALVRRLVPGSRARLAWVSRFLFPGVFVYDSTLTVSADHIAAVFAAPIFLLLIRAWRDLAPRRMLLLTVMAAGLVMTKYTGSLLLLAGPAIAVAARVPMLAVAALRKRTGHHRWTWAKGLALAVVAALVLTSPHWLKNWIWYGDPLYPVLHRHFSATPWTADATERYEVGFLVHDMWRPPANMEGVLQTLRVLLTFSFKPNDWAQFHGKVPVIGSLFTLGLFALPFVRGGRRLWALYVSAHVGIFAWYWLHHQDRYLQAAMPWMAAGVASVLILAWQNGWFVRAAVIPLVALQIIWGGDAYFIPAHAMIGSAPKAVIDLLAQGYKKNYDARLEPYGGLTQVGKTLPHGARVLIHDFRPRLGLGAQTVNDTPINQGGISYGLLGSPRAAWELLHKYRTTHLLWETKSMDSDSLAGDLVFYSFANLYGVDARRFGSFWLARMPDKPPPATLSDRVAFLGCDRPYHNGVYRLADLRSFGWQKIFPPPRAPAPAPRAPLDPFLGGVDYVVLDPLCYKEAVARVAKDFRRVGYRGRLQLWVRRPH